MTQKIGEKRGSFLAPSLSLYFFRSAGVFCAAPQLTECVEEAMKCVASTTEEALLSVSGKQPTQMKATTRVLNSKLKLLKTKF